MTLIFKFDYSQVKKLAGNGRIYVRLMKDLTLDQSSEDELPMAPGFSENPVITRVI